MALQFRRGVINDLPDPSDAAIGEPLFTTDEGKLRIKKADGTYAVIGSGTSTGELDLSGIAAGAMVKVNDAQDGFVAAAGGDVPSHTHPVANLQAGSAEPGDVVKFDGTNWVAGAITVSDTYDSPAFNAAVERELLVNLPASSGVLDIAQESTLTEFIDQFPVDGSGNLDIAQESTLQALAGRTLTAGTGLTGGGDLTADLTFAVNFGTTATTVAAGNHTHAADTLTTTATSTGYLKWTWNETSGFWAIAEAVASAPSVIYGGGADLSEV